VSVRTPVPRATPPAAPARLRMTPAAAVWVMTGTYAALFSYLSLRRHEAFWSGRFDLGNMVQAVWSTAQGRPLETTDMFGEQFTRLGAHVDPILVVFTPLAWTGFLPEALLVCQAVFVACGALPAFWLGRRWLGDDRLAVAAAAVYLLYPPLQWATITDFHPVTLAAPLLMFCVWAAEERRFVVLGVCAVGAALTKEQVGLALAMLGVWMAVRGARRAGVVLAAAGIAWVVVCMAVIIPRFNAGEGSQFTERYAYLGDGAAGIARGVLTRPWDVIEALASPGRLAYMAALLAPLLFLPLLAPLLALGALPELGINLLAEWYPQYSFRYHYVSVVVPFLVAASIAGLARVRSRAGRGVPPGAIAALWVGAVALSGVVMGPLPWWQHVPLGSEARAAQFSPDAHARVLQRAVAMVPAGDAVSAGNQLGAHLSARERIYFFPRIQEASWVVVDQRRPFVYGSVDASRHAAAVAGLRQDARFRVVFDEDGVIVARRRGGSGR